jgi:hypothetical protein
MYLVPVAVNDPFSDGQGGNSDALIPRARRLTVTSISVNRQTFNSTELSRIAILGNNKHPNNTAHDPDNRDSRSQSKPHKATDYNG